MVALLVPCSWVTQQKENEWSLLICQCVEQKQKETIRKKASRRNIKVGHLLNKCKFKHISSLKIKLKRTALMHVATPEPGLV